MRAPTLNCYSRLAAVVLHTVDVEVLLLNVDSGEAVATASKDLIL